DPARAWAANEGRLLPPSAAAAYAWLWIDHPAAGTSTFAAVCESLAVDRAAFTLSPAAQGNLRFEARLFIDAAAEVEEGTTGARDFLAALANQDREPVVRLLAEQTTVESNEESHMVTLRTDLS